MTGTRAFYRPIGTASLSQAVDTVASALAFAREKGASEVLVSVADLSGFDPPNTAERYFLAEKWAAAAGGRLRVALVIGAEMIDPHKFGVTVATTRGMVADVFTTEAEALSWLDGKRRLGG